MRKEKDLPWFRLQQWYFYGAAVFFSYGRFLKAKVAMNAVNAADPATARGLSWFVAHHSLMSYLAWMFG